MNVVENKMFESSKYYKTSLFILLLLIAFSVDTSAQMVMKDKYPMMPDKPVKNVIIFIGDGMGSAQVTVTRYNTFGPEYRLEIEKMPVIGLVNTYSADDYVTDSAAGATAMATGHKTKNGMDGMTPDSLPKETIFEAALREKKMSTGLVCTSSITDATPACFVVHVPYRHMDDEIADQIINSNTKIIMGGGRKYFRPVGTDDGSRKDNRNLIDSAKVMGYSFVTDSASLASAPDGKILGLFSPDGMTTRSPEPALADMTKKALKILSKDDNGFILMVEGSQIDWGGHTNNLDYVIRQTLLFDDAVKEGLKFAQDDGSTLVIVTADHETGGIALTSKDRKSDKSFGVKWATDGHTGIPVPIYAFGPHAIQFTGMMENTDIPKIIASLLNLGFLN